MPGLVGIVSKNNISLALFDNMLGSLNENDSYNIDKFLNSHICIGRVHLGIFNPKQQPIFNEDKSIFIFMDGKIYDYENEYYNLEKKGHKFKFKNDPEFCLHSYEEYGIDFLNKLNGSFIIAIVDMKNDKIIIANDRYGLRPLNYLINNGNLIFSPEIKAILKDNTFKKELNDSAVANFFRFGKFPGNETFIKGIKLLPPGSILVYDKGEISIEPYWELSFNPNYDKSDDEFVNELYDALKNAVKIRLEDELQYGISLSGGIDSRTITAVIPKELRENIVAFPHGSLKCNDVNIAMLVARKAGMKCNVLPITTDMVLKNSKKTVRRSDGSVYFGFNFYLDISTMMRNYKCDVVFSGVGLDTFITNPWLKRDVLQCKNKEELLKIMLDNWTFFSNEEQSKLFVPDYYNKIKDIPVKTFTDAFNKISSTHPGNISDHFDQLFHTRRYTVRAINLLNTKLEMILPGFDNKIIDIALTIPPEKRFQHHIYHKLLRKLSPELMKIKYNKTMIRASAPLFLWRIGKYIQHKKIYLKRKIFQWSNGKIILKDRQSYDNWDELFRMDDNWIKYFKDLLLNENALLKKYINQDYIKNLFKIHRMGKANKSHQLLYLATFEIFLNEFFSESSH